MSDTPGNKTSNLCGDLIFTFRFEALQHQVCRRRRSPWRSATAFGGPRQNHFANTSAQLLSKAIGARMKTSRHPRCCPACGHRFSFVAPRHPAFSPKTAPLVVSKQALTRQFDRQCFAICFAICILLAAAPFIQKSAWHIAIGLLGALLIMIVDAATVRLRPAPP